MPNADKIPNQQIYQNTANIISQVNQINEFPSETQNTVLVLNSINQNTNQDNHDQNICTISRKTFERSGIC